MGVQTDVLIADFGDAQAIADSAAPSSEWDGFTFNGFHNVQLCTLLSLLKTGSPDAEFERFLDAVAPVSAPAEVGPVVWAVPPQQVAELSAIAGLEESEFDSLASLWSATEEFAGWSESDVRNLLRELGDLAESASLTGKCLFLWQSL